MFIVKLNVNLKISDAIETANKSTDEFELNEESDNNSTENEDEDNRQSSEINDKMIDNDEENLISSKTSFISIKILDKIHPHLTDSYFKTQN